MAKREYKRSKLSIDWSQHNVIDYISCESFETTTFVRYKEVEFPVAYSGFVRMLHIGTGYGFVRGGSRSERNVSIPFSMRTESK